MQNFFFKFGAYMLSTFNRRKIYIPNFMRLFLSYVRLFFWSKLMNDFKSIKCFFEILVLQEARPSVLE